HHRRIAALRVRAHRLRQAARPAAKMPLAREIADARFSARRDAKPSSGNLPVAQADAAQLTPAAKRNRNRLVARSSVYRNIAILAVHPTGMMLVATGYKPCWAHRLLACVPSYSLAVRSCKEAQLYLRWTERRDSKAPPVEAPIDSK